jgi:hypothetical protein
VLLFPYPQKSRSKVIAKFFEYDKKYSIWHDFLKNLCQELKVKKYFMDEDEMRDELGDDLPKKHSPLYEEEVPEVEGVETEEAEEGIESDQDESDESAEESDY